MTVPDPNELFGQIVRLAVLAARRNAETNADQERFDQALAALALAAGLVAICWPRDRKLPAVITNTGEFIRHAWARRSWFLPSEATPEP
jgi:hypothetical protein